MSEKQLKAWRTGLKIASPLVLLIIWFLTMQLSGPLFYIIRGTPIFLIFLQVCCLKWLSTRISGQKVAFKQRRLPEERMD